LLIHVPVERLPANSLTLTLLTSLDYVVVAFAVAWRTFGALPPALGFSSLMR
jgi:hypothetical protein